MKKNIIRYIFLSFASFFISPANAQSNPICTLLETETPDTVTCFNPCVTLRANVMQGLEIDPTSTAYRIEQNTSCPLPPVTSGTPTTISSDDDWSSLITLPFTFYFFGQPYTELIIGDNGVVSFDTNRTSPQVQQPGGFCAWSFSASAPSPNLFRNTIFGAYHDLLLPAGGTISYYVSGTAPQRIFVINFDQVSHFSCTSLHTTQRILLYETLNVIDVQIIDKPVCSSWNGGRALIAIQDETGTQAYVPPGRNTGAWGASNELWRFIPDGPPTRPYTLTWYDMSNNVLGTGNTLQVCPTTTTSYRVDLEFDVDTQHYVISDTVTVQVDLSHDTVDLGPDQQICPGDTLTLDATTTGATAYQWYLNGSPIPGATQATFDATSDGTYSVDVEIGVCSTSDSMNISYYDFPQIDLGPDIVDCEGNVVTLDATPSNQTGNETYQWEKDNQVINGATSPTLDVTETGTYVVTVSDNCTSTDTIYVYFEPKPNLDLGADQIYCSYETATVSSNITNADSYEWKVNGSIVNTTDTQIQFSGPGDYDVELTINKGPCTVSDSLHVKILDPISITANPIIYGELEVNASGGLPPYSYSLNSGEYQSENHFTELPDGDYIVNVKDAHECEGDTLVHVTNLIVPPYMTPNEDGRHDVWRIINSEYTPEAVLRIFDRMGRLLYVMHTTPQEVWDGTFNGQHVPSDDYWYELTLPNGKVYRGHFAVIRK